ncbi:hypothetical protein HNQ92_001171 [Rhabdobacter roseus]|uniref:Uncharacterized protein n=1 Tax=Rhabdobacter roseus TaxID=1655419 RepID=A0A840TJD8_9BACT|nr:hypothetical protein [Rhabdobacter roseus]MBB5283045.1 hypothetical protein [Rhabdobacter roseus]
MKRIVSTSLLLMLVFFGALGQTPSDTIEIKKALGIVFRKTARI